MIYIVIGTVTQTEQIHKMSSSLTVNDVQRNAFALSVLKAIIRKNDNGNGNRTSVGRQVRVNVSPSGEAPHPSAHKKGGVVVKKCGSIIASCFETKITGLSNVSNHQ